MRESKKMPSAIDLENCILGAILLEADAINQITGIVSNENFFYNDRNKKIWHGIKQLHTEDKSIDSVTLFEKMKMLYPKYASELAIYITQLANGIGSAANIETHALLLKENYLRRRLIEVTSKYEVESYSENNDVFDVYDNILTELNTISFEITRSQTRSFADEFDEKVLHLKQAATNHSYLTGISTGLSEFDRVTLGFQKTDLVIVAGRPSMGKTAFAIDIARKQAKADYPIALFSLEMSSSQLIDRIIASETKLPLESVRKGGLKYEEWQQFDVAASHIRNLPIHICDKGGLDINEICSIAKNWKLKYQIQAIYVDYIQLISGSQNRNSNREQEISGISRRLKQLAKELNVPVVALSQLSRQCEQRTDKRPMLSDLRESGAIEQDADMVVFPYRDEYYNSRAEKGLCELLIAKNRNGKIGMVECYFNAECQTFLNEAP